MAKRAVFSEVFPNCFGIIFLCDACPFEPCFLTQFLPISVEFCSAPPRSVERMGFSLSDSRNKALGFTNRSFRNQFIIALFHHAERTQFEESSGFSSHGPLVDVALRAVGVRHRELVFCEKLQNKSILKGRGLHSNLMLVECRTAASETSIEW